MHSFKSRDIPIFTKGPSKIRNWKKAFQCIHCSKFPCYNIDEFGKLNCKYHTGSIHNNRYTCCNNPIWHAGCKARCHSDKARPWYILTKHENDFITSNNVKLSIDKRCEEIMKNIEKDDVIEQTGSYCFLLDTGADTGRIKHKFNNILKETKRTLGLMKKNKGI